MNAYARKLMTYHIVHQLHREGLSAARISKELVMDWRTVKKYLSMSEKEYETFISGQSERKRELEPYEGFVKSRLEKYSDTSAAQMQDWLKEHYSDFPNVSSKTVFNFVCLVRRKYHLQKTVSHREFSMVPETPYGVQAQADFGQYNLRNTLGRQIKVYFFVMVLARSRYKYVFFSTTSFTTELTIQAHQQAFLYFEGLPQTVVYDQDRLLLVDENFGDLILTDKFRTFSQSTGFALHFCRKSDPQSKGKIENVVKYVKQNFLYNRSFDDIETLNQQALAWLGRTANHLPHGVTRKSPALEWETEKMYLGPYTVIPAPAAEGSWYSVRKDNSISYKGNFYSLPQGTYTAKGCRVRLVAQEGRLFVFDQQETLICTHALSLSKGHKIINNDHKRSKNLKIDELIEQLCNELQEPSLGNSFINAVRKVKPRYLRDQLMLFRKIIENYHAAIVHQSLQYACTHQLNSVTDLQSVAEYLYRQQNNGSSTEVKIIQMMNPFNGKIPAQALIQPATSSITDYSDLF